MTSPNETTGTSLQLGTVRYLYTLFFVGGCMVAYLASHVVDTVWFGHENASNAIGAAVGVVAVVAAWRNQPVRTYARETIDELAAVTWPSKQETTNATIVVIVTAVVAALVIFAMDQFWRWVTNAIYLPPASG